MISLTPVGKKTFRESFYCFPRILSIIEEINIDGQTFYQLLLEFYLSETFSAEMEFQLIDSCSDQSSGYLRSRSRIALWTSSEARVTWLYRVTVATASSTPGVSDDGSGVSSAGVLATGMRWTSPR
jgi:hypothetical protein